MPEPILVVPPTAKPLDVAAAKLWCRVDGVEEESLISDLIDAAISRLDGWAGLLGRALEEQSWELRLDGFPDVIQLPLGPVVSVTSISYPDASGDRVELAADAWDLTAVGIEADLRPISSWPVTGGGEVRVRWVAGTGCPPALRHQLKVLVAYWFDRRDSGEIPPGVHAAIAPWRRVNL